MKLASLGSGSKGNSTIVCCGETCVLIDCGFSLRQFEKRLQKLAVSANDIDAILVTHEHSDHGSGVSRLAQKYQIPLYMTVGTARALKLSHYQLIKGGQLITLDDLQIHVVTVPHDAAEPVQFVFTELSSGRKFGLLTDSGHITSHMREAYDNLHGLLLEFNYDEEMLEKGPYPAGLKLRISGSHGHLSNLQSVELLQQVNTGQLECLIAAHISEKNNSPQLVAELLQDLGIRQEPVLACQQHGFEWTQL